MTSSTHMNGRLDTADSGVLVVFFDTTNPDGAWINDTGQSTGSCTSLNCHGPETLDWYGTGTAHFDDCSICHSKQLPTRRPIVGGSGDFAGNAPIVSHHVTSTGDPAGNQCRVCHDLSHHTAGMVRLRNADTGDGIAYDPNAPSTLQPFCLSCHDTDSASVTSISGSAVNPFNDGSVLGGPPPNRYEAGNKIAGYWNSSANIHKTNGGLTCAGTGYPGSGCHGSSRKINMHGSTNAGLLVNTMNFQIEMVSYSSQTPLNPFVYDNYRLCLECHDNYQTVSAKAVLG